MNREVVLGGVLPSNSLSRLASPISRMRAFSLDMAFEGLCGLIGGVAGSVVGPFLFKIFSPYSQFPEHLLLNVEGAGFVWGWAYWIAFAFFLNRGLFPALTGSTLGMRAFGLHFHRARGEESRPSALLLIVRAFFAVLAAAPFLAGFLGILLHPRRQGVHDWLTDIEVHQKSKKRVEPSRKSPPLPETTEAEPPQDQVA